MLAARRSVSRSALRVRTAGRVLRTSETTAGATRVARPPTAGVASSAVRAGFATTGRLYGGRVRAGPYTGPGDAARGAEPALSPAPSGPHGFRLKNRLRFLAGRWPETDPTHLPLFSPDDLRALLAGFEEPRLHFVSSRFVRIHPRLFGNIVVFAGRKSR